MSQSLRFLHLADLHLGLRLTRFSPEAVDKIREARFKALEHARAELSRTDAAYDFVIIAGDLFDDGHIKESIANRAFNLLSSFPVPVLLISGNHDPVEPGALWELSPWNREDRGVIHWLPAREPFRGIEGVTIFPCPVFRKRSATNPTAWIADHPRKPSINGNPGDGHRIVIAHGSVMDRPDLPHDDHPISATAPQELDVDYIALGHWHRHKVYTDQAGTPRMCYPGVHEPMRFRDDQQASGWRAYASAADREEFLDDGAGLAVAVTIPAPGEPPQLETLRVQNLQWTARSASVQSEADFDELLQNIAEARQPERTLLKLSLGGSLPIQAMQRLDELREILGRYLVGELDDSALLVEPTAEECREVIGGGVLELVHQRLHQALDGDSSDEMTSAATETPDPAVLDRATRLLYQLAARSRE